MATVPARLRILAPLACFAIGGCGSSNQSSSSSSPLDDLAARLPAPSRLVTGLGSSSTDGTVASQAFDLLTTTLDYVDGLRNSWCFGKASTTAGSIVVSGSTPTDASLTGGTYHGLSITRMVAAGASSCSSQALTAFWIRLDIVGFDTDGAALPTPWHNDTRLSRVVLFGRVSSSADGLANDSFTAADLAFVMLTGHPSAPMTAADDWAHLPAVPTGLGSLDAGNLTAVFFPQQIQAAGVGFGDNSTLPEVLTLIVDLSDANQRSQLALLKWEMPDGMPLAIDLRIEDGVAATGAAVFDQSGTPVLSHAFFVELRTAATPAGFALDGTDATNLLEAWDVNGQVTHTTGSQGSYTVPVDFDGWPGASSVWTAAFGQGMSTQFDTALGAAAPVATWFGN